MAAHVFKKIIVQSNDLDSIVAGGATFQTLKVGNVLIKTSETPPAGGVSPYAITLPAVAGAPGQVLQLIDNSGSLEWATPAESADQKWQVVGADADFEFGGVQPPKVVSAAATDPFAVPMNAAGVEVGGMSCIVPATGTYMTTFSCTVACPQGMGVASFALRKNRALITTSARRATFVGSEEFTITSQSIDKLDMGASVDVVASVVGPAVIVNERTLTVMRVA